MKEEWTWDDHAIYQNGVQKMVKPEAFEILRWRGFASDYTRLLNRAKDEDR